METIARGFAQPPGERHGALLDVLVDARVVALFGGRDLLAGDARQIGMRHLLEHGRVAGGRSCTCSIGRGSEAGATGAGVSSGPAGWQGPSRQHRGARGSGHTRHDTVIAPEAL